ncbi:12293_t:CDS:2 [Funneliformis geosporum]|uniref:12293_t:CDS:1 n=1 Tax=Funneliformis geosporum TaxID=1117311 RepID=A0A9W4SGL4_9GLOM|nr:12293_t:CDS:2 [Funneliformis geosporum]
MTSLVRRVWSISTKGTFANLVLEDDILPPPPPKHLRVQVKSIGLNFADIFSIFGLYSATPKGKFIPGLEFSGIVESVGEGIEESEWLGKRVYGATRFGGYATHLNIEEEYVKQTPDNWTDQQAAAYVVQAMTSFYALTELGRIKENKTVLVHSAAGGCGLLALSICSKYENVKVVGTIGNPSKFNILNQNYGDNENFTFILREPSNDFEKRARQALLRMGLQEQDGYDIILDSVMGNWFWSNYNLLAKEGKHVLFGSASFTPTGNLHPIWNMYEWLKLGWKYIWRPKIDPMEILQGNKSLLGFNLIHIYERAERLNQIFNDMQSLQLEAPHVGHEFEFDQLIEALTLLQSGNTVGKVILSVNF